MRLSRDDHPERLDYHVCRRCCCFVFSWRCSLCGFKLLLSGARYQQPMSNYEGGEQTYTWSGESNKLRPKLRQPSELRRASRARDPTHRGLTLPVNPPLRFRSPPPLSGCPLSRAMCVKGGLSEGHAPIHPLDMEDIKELEVRVTSAGNQGEPNHDGKRFTRLARHDIAARCCSCCRQGGVQQMPMSAPHCVRSWVRACVRAWVLRVRNIPACMIRQDLKAFAGEAIEEKKVRERHVWLAPCPHSSSPLALVRVVESRHNKTPRLWISFGRLRRPPFDFVNTLKPHVWLISFLAALLRVTYGSGIVPSQNQPQDVSSRSCGLYGPQMPTACLLFLFAPFFLVFSDVNVRVVNTSNSNCNSSCRKNTLIGGKSTF